MNPHILYWKWNDDVLEESVMREKTEDIINNSSFDIIYICFHSVSEENRILSSDKGINALKKCVDLFKAHGRKVVIDTEFCTERKYIEENINEHMTQAKAYSGKLDENGKFNVPAEEDDRFIAAWKVLKLSEKVFKNPVNISKCCKLEGGVFTIDAGEKNAGSDILYYLSITTKREDAFSESYDKERRKVFERLEGIPFGGAATDEMGIGSMDKCEKLVDRELESIEYLDINKVNFYMERIPYSAGMEKTYNERYGESLADNLLYFWHREEGNEGKSISVVNNYFENTRKRCAVIEENLYKLTKEFFGDDAFVGAHSTIWGDELDNNFDKFNNGLDWWETKRDYAQTDELILIPIRLGMARKCTKNIWYNMWYSMRTMDIRSYYKETYTNVIFGGRTHHLGYECYEPGVVLCLNQKNYLNDLSCMEDKISILDRLQRSRPDSRVLAVFGYEAATNHHISDPEAFRTNRRGTIMYEVLKATKEIFDKSHLLELVPSSEIDNGSICFENGKASFNGHEYDAVVLMYPDGITKSVYEKLKSVENLIVCGEINFFHDGEKAENKAFENALCLDKANSDEIIKELNRLGIKKNKGKNYCIFEDGSITFANPEALKNTQNGVECEEYRVSEKDSDIVFIDSNGSRYLM